MDGTQQVGGTREAAQHFPEILAFWSHPGGSVRLLWTRDGQRFTSTVDIVECGDGTYEVEDHDGEHVPAALHHEVLDAFARDCRKPAGPYEPEFRGWIVERTCPTCRATVYVPEDSDRELVTCRLGCELVTRMGIGGVEVVALEQTEAA